MLLLMEEYRRMEKVKRELENHIENSKNRLKLQLEQKQEKYNEFEEKMNSLLANAKKESPRAIDEKDVARIFGV